MLLKKFLFCHPERSLAFRRDEAEGSRFLKTRFFCLWHQNDRGRILWLMAFLMVSALDSAADKASIDHSLWQELLSKYVRQEKVNYKGLLQEQAVLQQYLMQLKQADPQQESREEQIAFWINAYNASVIRGVLDHWPIQSVKEVRNFFDSRDYKIAGKQWSLNEIEKHLRQFGDFRVHFALVCASRSCPVLIHEPYLAGSLDQQLDRQAKKFLSDPQKGLRLDRDKKILWVSKIFQWYEEDFVHGGIKKSLDLITAIEPFLAEDVRQAAKKNPYQIRYLDYDWRLND